MTKSSTKALALRLLLAAFAVLSVSAAALAQDGVRVVATIAPLHSLTAGVMAGVGEPELLMKPGDSPHHFTMKPHDAKMLMTADLIICTSLEYEYYLAPLMSALPERHRTVSEALSIPGMALLNVADTPGESGVDMHFWLNPLNAIAFTRHIAEQLARIDKKHAETYSANAARQVEALKALDREIAAQLHSRNKKPQAYYASYHASLRYFEDRYDIHGGKTVTRTPESGASVEEAERLNAGAASGELRCLFREPEFAPRLLERVAKAHHGKTRLLTLDTLGSTYPPGAEAYPAMMRDIAAQVSQCIDKDTP